MTDQGDEADKSKLEEPARRRLLRSNRERMLWGVAGGIGEYLNVDPTLVRLGFVAAAFFGGFGVIAYLAMAVIVPEDDGTGRPKRDRRPPLWPLILLGVAILIALPGPFWGWDDGHHGGWWWGIVWPLWIAALIVAGFWAYRALAGRPRQRRRAPRGDAGGEGEPAEAEAAGESAATAATAEPPRAVRVIAIVILVIAAASAICLIAALSAWTAATGNGSIVAGTVIVLGLAVAASAFADRLRRAAPVLLAAALVLALPAGAVAAADIRFDGGIGEREYRPASIAELPADGYELGVGQLIVDLRDLPWATERTVPLSSELGIGQMIVSVPADVCVVADARAKAGELVVRGESSAGVDPELDQGAPIGDAPRLELDAEVQLGRLIVTDRDPDEVEGRDYHDGDDSAEAAVARKACGR